MAKILSEIVFTKGKRMPGYMVTLEDGTLVLYTDNGLLVTDVETYWLLSQDLGEFSNTQEFETLTGVRPIVMVDFCNDCGIVRALDGSPCVSCNLIRDANPGLELVQ